MFNIEPQNVIKDEITQSLFEKLKRIHNIKMCSLEHSDLAYRLLIMKWVLLEKYKINTERLSSVKIFQKMYDITTLIDVEMQTLCSTFQKKFVR